MGNPNKDSTDGIRAHHEIAPSSLEVARARYFEVMRLAKAVCDHDISAAKLKYWAARKAASEAYLEAVKKQGGGHAVH